MCGVLHTQVSKFAGGDNEVSILRRHSGGYESRVATFHPILLSADFPAKASCTPFKGSTSAHQFDPGSNMDQRHPHYGKPNSFLRPDTPGVPSVFQRRTEADIDDVLLQAAAESTKAERERVLDNAGLCLSNFHFDEFGNISRKFAWSPEHMNGADYVRGHGQDGMHTSFQGHVPMEIYLKLFVFIRVRAALPLLYMLHSAA